MNNENTVKGFSKIKVLDINLFFPLYSPVVYTLLNYVEVEC